MGKKPMKKTSQAPKQEPPSIARAIPLTEQEEQYLMEQTEKALEWYQNMKKENNLPSFLTQSQTAPPPYTASATSIQTIRLSL